MSRQLTPLAVMLAGAVVALGCGGASDTDFGQGDGSTDTGGSGGSSEGGSTQGGSAQGGSAQGGSGGGDQGGTANGGATGSGGASGTGAGGGTSGGSGGSGEGGTDPIGGTGGAPGGSGPGGSGGTPGPGGGGQGGRDCAAIIANAQAALLAAEACNPAVSAPRCAGSVEDLCGCTVPVNDPDSTATKNYLAQREAAVRCGVPCLAIVCREPTTATCGIGGATTNIVVAQSYCRYSLR